MYLQSEHKVWLATGEGPVYLEPGMANRHGLIAGATGTGKTVTLKVLAESFSDMGVPVFLAVCYGISNLIDTEALEMASGAGSEVAAVFGMTKAAALAYLMFNLFTPPCFAAIGAMNSEIADRKWLLGGIGLQLATGFTAGYLVYQIGTLITEGHLGAGFLPGLIAVAAIAVFIGSLCAKGDAKRSKKGIK